MCTGEYGLIIEDWVHRVACGAGWWISASGGSCVYTLACFVGNGSSRRKAAVFSFSFVAGFSEVLF